jgi:hypothetical protein
MHPATTGQDGQIWCFAGFFPVGNLPAGLAVDGNSNWMAGVEHDTITKLRANDRQILQTI